MAYFEAPSFSLGLDFDLLNSESKVTSVNQDVAPSSSNQFSVVAATLKVKDGEFETLVIDDSEPEYPDQPPKVKRLRRRRTVDATSSSFLSKTKVELHSKAVVNDEDIDEFSSQNDRHTESYSNQGQSDLHQHVGLIKPIKVNELIDLSTTKNTWEDLSPEKSFHTPKPAMDDIQEYFRSMKHNSDSVETHRSSHVTRTSLDLDDFLPPAHRYFFHDDPRVQELVRSRLPNFIPLGDVSNRDLEQPCTSKIDYMGQFIYGESSKQGSSKCNGSEPYSNKENPRESFRPEKGSTSRKISRKSKTEEMSEGWVNPKLGIDEGIMKGASKRRKSKTKEDPQGWVNPKLGVDKRTTKGASRRKVHAVHQTAGHWLTDPEGKKVYVSNNGQKLTAQLAYRQYSKESGLGFKKTKRKSATKKKKK